MEWPRLILHVDMDAFYASVEQHDDPALRGRPVVVGGSGPRGVVAAASYEARRSGVRSAMPGAEARRRCPEAVFIRPRMARYKEVSRQVFAILEAATPVVQGLSLDEAFLDLSEDPAARRDPHAAAAAIKQRIREVTGLDASVGVAPNKLVAKIASDLEKPDGLTVIPSDAIRARLDPLPIARLWGVGPQTGSRLRRLGIETFRDLREAPEELLRRAFGRHHQRMRERAAGIDHRPVQERARERSISAEETFRDDLSPGPALDAELTRLCEDVGRRLRRAGLAAGTLALKLRDPDFNTATRQRPMVPPGDASAALRELASRILTAWHGERPGVPLRLLGVVASDLRTADQLDLFQAPASEGEDGVADAVRERFGRDAIRPARLLDRGPRYDDDEHEG